MPAKNLQKSNDLNGQKFYAGLDIHKKSWVSRPDLFHFPTTGERYAFTPMQGFYLSLGC